MEIPQLVDSLDAAAKTWGNKTASQATGSSVEASRNADRAKLLAAARRLVSVLQNPHNAILEISKWPAGHGALRTALMLKVFEGWASEQAKTASEIAEATGAEELLIVRIMRVLVSIGIFEEKGDSIYTHNILSRTLIDPTFRTLIIGGSSTAGLTMAKLPEYLSSLNFRSPSDPEKALFQYALGTELNMFEWLKTHPEQLAVFSAYNTAATKIQGRSLQATISALFPKMQSEVPTGEAGLEEDQVLLVDVGAGRGQALRDVRVERPDLAGRIVAQDLPEVIAGRDVAEGVENMIYDFLNVQPVKGASVYFFCHIFHNWPDVICRRILANTIDALTPNHSRIVIVDQVLPDTGAPAFSTFMDLSMMTFGGMERTERQWRELLEGVGLSVVRIEGPNAASLSRDGTVEAILRG